jgi:hypothetical protein
MLLSDRNYQLIVWIGAVGARLVIDRGDKDEAFGDEQEAGRHIAKYIDASSIMIYPWPLRSSNKCDFPCHSVCNT